MAMTARRVWVKARVARVKRLAAGASLPLRTCWRTPLRMRMLRRVSLAQIGSAARMNPARVGSPFSAPGFWEAVAPAAGCWAPAPAGAATANRASAASSANEVAIARTEDSGFSRIAVTYTHLRAHETVLDLVCRLLLEKKK